MTTFGEVYLPYPDPGLAELRDAVVETGEDDDFVVTLADHLLAVATDHDLGVEGGCIACHAPWPCVPLFSARGAALAWLRRCGHPAGTRWPA